MKSKKSLINYVVLSTLLLFFFTGCTSVPIGLREGFLFTSIKAPLSTNFNKASNDPALIKVSKRRTHWFNIPFIGLDFAWGHAGIKKIAEQGGIHEISYADYEFLSILNIPVFSLSLYKSFTINVYGYGPKQTAKKE